MCHPLFWGGNPWISSLVVSSFPKYPIIMMLYSTSRQIHYINTSFQAWNTSHFRLHIPATWHPNQLYREMSSVLHLNSSPWYTGLSQNMVHRKLTRESDDIFKTSDVGSFPSFQTNPYPRTINTSMLVPHRILYISPHYIISHWSTLRGSNS